MPIQLLKFDSVYREGQGAFGYIYIATNGDSPDVAQKGVLLPNIKCSNIFIFLTHKTLNEYLGIAPKEKATLWRISTSSQSETWIEIKNRKHDYGMDSYKALIDKIETDFPALLHHGHTQSAIQHLYGVPQYALRRLKAAITEGKTNEDKYREVRFNENGLRYFHRIFNDVLTRDLTIMPVSHESKFENDNLKEGFQKVRLETSKATHHDVTYRGKPTKVLFEKNLYQINHPSLRIRNQTDEEWTHFCANSLMSSEALVTYFYRNQIAPFSDMLSDNNLVGATIATLFGSKAVNSEALQKAFSSVEIEVFTAQDKWETLDIHTSQIEETLDLPADTSTMMINRVAISKLGYRTFTGYLQSPLEKMSILRFGQSDIDVWVRWCKKHSPEFIELHTYLTGQPIVEKPRQRRKHVEVLDYKPNRIAVPEATKEQCAKFALPIFLKQWQKLHEQIGLSTPTIDNHHFFDTQDKFKEFYLSFDGENLKLEINTGHVMYKVDMDKEDQGLATVSYLNPRRNIEGTFTLEEYLTLKAREYIAELVIQNSERYTKAILEKEIATLALWKTKVKAVNTVIGLMG